MIVPSIPEARCPSIEQYISYLPGLRSTVSLALEPGCRSAVFFSASPLPSTLRLWTIAPSFLTSIVTLPAFAVASFGVILNSLSPSVTVPPPAAAGVLVAAVLVVGAAGVLAGVEADELSLLSSLPHPAAPMARTARPTAA